MRRFVHVEKTPTTRVKAKKKGVKSPQSNGNSSHSLVLKSKSRGFETFIEEVPLQEKVLNLRTQGYLPQEIARKLDLHPHEVGKLLLDAMEELTVRRDEAAQKYLQFANAVYNRLFQTWMPKAVDHYETIKTSDGDVQVVVPGDPEAARLMGQYLRDAAKMHGLNKTRVEVTGKDGGPVIDAKFILNQFNQFNEAQLEKIRSGDQSFLSTISSAGVIGSGRVGAEEETETEEEEVSEDD